VRIGEKEPKVLGGKVLGSLGGKMSKFSLDKKGNLVQNWGASRSVAYPKSAPTGALAWRLDMQDNEKGVYCMRRSRSGLQSDRIRTYPRGRHTSKRIGKDR